MLISLPCSKKKKNLELFLPPILGKGFFSFLKDATRVLSSSCGAEKKPRLSGYHLMPYNCYINEIAFDLLLVISSVCFQSIRSDFLFCVEELTDRKTSL